MIESPASTAIIESAPPAYADEPDSPLEKKGDMMPSEAMADQDIEITVIQHKPITASIKASVRHLHTVGGFFGRFRGAGVGAVYHMLHGLMTNFLAGVLGLGIFGHALMHIVSSLGLARIHMAWTHSMIAAPSDTPIFRRFVPRQQCRALLLPTFVFAVAQQATFLLPMATAFALKLDNVHHADIKNAAREQDCAAMMLMGLRFLAVPAVALFVGLAVLLPAAVTLTRIEATLLPEGSATIVPFDRQAIMGDVDPTVCGGSRQLFVQAWRSFDRSARLRLVKVYVKMVFAQLVVAFVAVHLVVAELYLIGGERLAPFVKSAVAQIKLAAIEAHKQRAEAGVVVAN